MSVQKSTRDIDPDGEATDADDMPLTQFRYCTGETVTDLATLEDALRRGLEKNEIGQAALIDVFTGPGTR